MYAIDRGADNLAGTAARACSSTRAWDNPSLACGRTKAEMCATRCKNWCWRRKSGCVQNWCWVVARVAAEVNFNGPEACIQGCRLLLFERVGHVGRTRLAALAYSAGSSRSQSGVWLADFGLLRLSAGASARLLWTQVFVELIPDWDLRSEPASAYSVFPPGARNRVSTYSVFRSRWFQVKAGSTPAFLPDRR